MSQFLTAWQSFFHKSTDASAEYAEAAGLSVLATAVVGHRTLDIGTGLSPCLFILITGPSSVARKSTSVRLARKLVETVMPDRVGPSDFTSEGLFRALERKDANGKSRSKLTLFADEYGSDLARMEAYATTMQADMCKIYDGESIEIARSKLVIVIPRPRVTFIGAGAYAMFRKYFNVRDWESGYMMRFIFVSPWTFMPPKATQPQFDHAAFGACTNALEHLIQSLHQPPANAHGHASMVLSAQARQMFEHYSAWCLAEAQRAKAEGRDTDGLQELYVSRFTQNLLKVAMLYQIDNDPTDLNIQGPAMQKAIKFMMNSWASFLEMLLQTGASVHGIAEKIVGVLRVTPGYTLAIPSLYGFLSEQEQRLFPEALQRLRTSCRVSLIQTPTGQAVRVNR